MAFTDMPRTPEERQRLRRNLGLLALVALACWAVASLVIDALRGWE